MEYNTKEVFMLRRAIILAFLLILIAGCVQYEEPYYPGPGRAIAMGPAIQTYLLQTDSLMMEDIIDDVPVVENLIVELPDAYAPSALQDKAVKVLRGFDAGICAKVPDSELRDGNPYCTGTIGHVSSNVDTLRAGVNTLASDDVYVPTGMATVTGMQAVNIYYDLEITDATVTPATANPGDVVDVEMDITNNGPSASPAAVHIELTTAGVKQSEYLGQIIDPAQTITKNAQVMLPTTLTPGTHTIDIELVTLGTVWTGSGYAIESNKTNNDYSVNIGVTGPGPDLEWLTGTYTGMLPQPVAGTGINVQMEVTNNGAENATAATIKLYWDSKTGTPAFEEDLSQFHSMPFKPGDTTNVGATLTPIPATAGVHDLIFVIETTPSDINPANNEAIIPITFVAAPAQIDLEMKGISPTRSSFYENEPVVLNLVTENTGNNEVEAEIAVFIDGNFRKSIVRNVTPGISTTQMTIDQAIHPLGIGTHTITAEEDYLDRVAETNENNNEAQQGILIVPLPPGSGVDLVADELIWTMTLKPNGNYTVNFEGLIENAGNVQADIVSAAILVDGKVIAEPYSTTVLRPGHSRTVYGTTELAPGVYTAELIADYEEELIELDENNNELTATIDVGAAQRPNLIIESMTYNPDPAIPGQQVTVTTVVKNAGVEPSDATELSVNVGGMTTPTIKTVPPLDPDETAPITQVFMMTSTPITVEAEADPNDNVLETSETDNTRTITVYPPMPDLDAYDIVFEKAVYDAYEPIQNIQLYLANTGMATATGTNLRLYIDGNLEEEWAVALSAGDKYTPVYNIPGGLLPGTHTFRLVVDEDDDVQELSETNNEYTKTLTVGQLPSLILSPGTVLPPTTTSAPGFLIGTCKSSSDPAYNPMVRARLGAAYCDAMQQGDGVIRSYTGSGPWNIVIAGATQTDVNSAINLFLELGTLGPAEIYEYFEFRMTGPVLRLFAKYENSNQDTLHMLDYKLATPEPTTVVFPIGFQDNDIADAFAPIVNDIESIYRWDEGEERWRIWHTGPEPSDMDTVQPYDAYFVMLDDNNFHDFTLVDVQEQARSRTLGTGRALFSPTRPGTIDTWDNIVDTTEEILCQEPASYSRGWFFSGPRPADQFIDIGQACWVTSTGGTLQ